MGRPNNPFVGFWRLRSFEQQTPRGAAYPFGRNPTGIIAYHDTGVMSVQLVCDPLPGFANVSAAFDPLKEPVYKKEADGRSFQELEAVFDGYLAYFGKYSVDWTAGTVTHQVEGSNRPSFIHKQLVRAFEFSGDLLSLSPPAPEESPVTLVWQRVGGPGNPD